MTTLGHRASRVIDQRSDVVHDRLIQLGERLRTEAPPVEPGTQAATVLGMSGPIGIEILDQGPSRIEIRTTQGRIRGEGVAGLAPTADGRTTLTMDLEIKPQGFAANMMLGVALKTMPNVERQVIDGLEAGLDSLAVELAKSDADWDPAAWNPPGLPARG